MWKGDGSKVELIGGWGGRGGGYQWKTIRMNIVGTLNLGVNQKLPPLCFPQSHHPVNLFPNVFCSRPSSTPIISFNTDITQISKKIWETNQEKIETFFQQKSFWPWTFCFLEKDFLLRGLSLGSVLFPRGLTTSAPCIFYSDHERWSPREFCFLLDPWPHLWKNCQKKKAAKREKENVGHLCQDWRCKSCPNQKFLPPKKINSSPHLLKGCLDFLNFDSSTNNASALNSYYISSKKDCCW